jgi:hypothetical protein
MMQGSLCNNTSRKGQKLKKNVFRISKENSYLDGIIIKKYAS